MQIKRASLEDAADLSRYYLENAAHLEPWERRVEDGFHSVEAWQQRLRQREIEQQEGRSVYFLGCSKRPHEIIATCSLTGITQGAFMACFMGYSVAAAHEGRGLMKRLCKHATDHAFHELGLNRVMCNYMPRNTRSEKLLQGMGFVQEGLAKKYLFINGRWEDHILTSLLHPDNR